MQEGRVLSAVGIALLDVGGGFLEVSDGFAEISGWRQKDVKGLSVQDLLPESERRRWTRFLSDSGPEARRFSPGTIPMLTRTGELSPVRFEAFRPRGEGGLEDRVVLLVTLSPDGTEASASGSPHEYQHLFESIPAGLFRSTADGRLLMANSALARMLGYESAGELMRTASVEALYFEPASRQEVLERVDRGDQEPIEVLLRRKDGSQLTTLLRSRAVLGPSGRVEYYEGMVLDIEHRKRVQEEVRLRERLYRTMLEALPDLAARLRADGRILAVSGEEDDWLIEDPTLLPGRMIHDWLPSEVCRPALASVEAALRDRQIQVFEFRLEKEGAVRDFEARVSPLAVDEALVVFRDITDRKIRMGQLEHLANYDFLTHLPNRFLFRERLGQALRKSRRSGRPTALLYLDLDGFKQVNDTHGHSFGDSLLRMVAQRLVTTVREGDTVARLGGDEFALVVADLNHSQDAALVARKILEALAQPFKLGGHELRIRASIGISIYPEDARDLDLLIHHADTAMYRSKEEYGGRGGYQFFIPEMTRHAERRVRVERDLRRAVERDEFVVHYQPRIDLETGLPTGVEALVRWMHPRRGLVKPDQFIELAEETGLILSIGESVFRQACRRAKIWQDAGHALTVAVNLSRRQLQDERLADIVRAVLEESGLSPDRLELEIREEVAMASLTDGLGRLSELKGLGVRLSIDNFGTAYSGLSYLRKLEVDSLKIDRSFIERIRDAGETRSHETAVIRSIVALARALNFRVIGEGVESEAQRDFLRALGCDLAQGYSIGVPVESAEIDVLLESNRQRR